MATVPDALSLGRHRDRQGRTGPWARWLGVSLLLVIPIAALLDVFGQRTDVSMVSTPTAQLKLFAPSSGRGGLMYAARFQILAHGELKHATLVLAPGWADQYTVNGISPQPSSESSDNGRLSFSLGDILPGKTFTEFISLQINPVNVGDHEQTVWLYNGPQQVAVLHHDIMVWP